MSLKAEENRADNGQERKLSDEDDRSGMFSTADTKVSCNEKVCQRGETQKAACEKVKV